MKLYPVVHGRPGESTFTIPETAVGVSMTPLYTLRHTCLTRWAPHLDPWSLACLAGHRDMNITKRYLHPREHYPSAPRWIGLEAVTVGIFWAYHTNCESGEDCFGIATD